MRVWPILVTLLSGALLSAPLAAQAAKSGEAKAGHADPYTRGEEAAMRKAGYVSFEPFDWADGHTTTDVQEVIGHAPMLWVETTHFKIGTSLGLLKVADSEDVHLRSKIRRELESLGKRLPRLNPTNTVLDPWLRLHLLAHRCEAVYADMAKRLGVEEGDFPVNADAAYALDRFMGSGPYFGMPSKFTVLVFAEESSLARYFARYIGTPPRHGQRHHYRASGSLLFATASEFDRGLLHDDTRMHCHVVFNVAHNLVDGYRGYYHDVPAWWRTGLSQWLLRRVDPRHNNFNAVEHSSAQQSATWKWQPLVRALVQAKKFEPAEDLCCRMTWVGWEFEDHMLAWSRVDYLMSLGDSRFAMFLNAMKDPFDRYLRAPGAASIMERQEAALALAYDIPSLQELDRRWACWVLDSYER